MKKNDSNWISSIWLYAFSVVLLAVFSTDITQAGESLKTVSGEIQAFGAYMSTESSGEKQISSGNYMSYGEQCVKWGPGGPPVVAGRDDYGNTITLPGTGICEKYENLSYASMFGQPWLSGNVLVIPQTAGWYAYVQFDDDGNVVNWWHNALWAFAPGTPYDAASRSICAGDDNSCKDETWANLIINLPKKTSCDFQCAHKDSYKYTFRYETKKQGDWNLCDEKAVNKCEDIRLQFTPEAEWFGELKHVCIFKEGGQKIYTINLPSPPTNLLACADQASCLSQANEYSLTPTTFGRGVQKTPEGFVAATQNSLTGNDDSIECSGGDCIPYASGNFVLSATAPETPYFGQCRGQAVSETLDGKTITAPEVTINTAEAKVPAIKNDLSINVINRPPVATVTFAKNPISSNEEVDVYCDIVDPDECSDKIASVKWTCVDSTGTQRDCSIYNASGIIGTSFTEQIPAALQSNPYRATAKFKAHKEGAYAVVCEGQDNDTNIPLRGEVGVAGIQVGNGVPIPGTTDEGVIGASAKYCTILANGGSNKALCGKSANVNHKALTYGINVSEYQWKCGEEAGEEWKSSGVKDDYTCSYDSTGNYLANLRVKDQDTGNWFNCYSDEKNKVKVTDTNSCKVTARKLDSQNEFSDTPSVKMGDTLEVKAERECLESGEAKWTLTDGTKLDEKGDILKVKFDSSGPKTIKATIGSTACQPLNIDIKESVNWALE